jgi:hypothetical protein
MPLRSLQMAWHIHGTSTSFMMIGSGIQVILRALTQQFGRSECWYYWCEGFTMYAIDMNSGGMLYTYQVS